jgi:SAM-dependent methyltransferase
MPESYRYFSSRSGSSLGPAGSVDDAIQLGRERLQPSLKNVDYLVLRERRRHIANFLASVTDPDLSVLNVGGRIQPYRPLLGGRLRSYVAADPQLEGLVDVVCVGETLPFRDSSFNLVMCTQVLTYVSDPARVVAEIYRVMRKGGHLILSVPSFFPEHHDERWRILPGGLRLLLARFETLRIEPEGHSIAGLFRALNVCLHHGMGPTWRRLAEHTTIPALNLAGWWLDHLAGGNDMCTANYSVLARK